jgi:hypothetical protein
MYFFVARGYCNSTCIHLRFQNFSDFQQHSQD